MSHIAEVYAKDIGVKIGRPKITEHFFPGLPDKYITFQASNKMPAKNYFYWDVVISIIKFHINDVKIVQVGGPGDPKINGVDLFAPSSYKQMNYIIKNSIGHFGMDSLPMHVASVYDKPITALFGNLFKENALPLWNKKSKAVCLEPDFSEKKPSFGTNCNRINEIKPEKIAQSVIDQLGSKEKVKFKTINIGKTFHRDIVEIVPNFFAVAPEIKDKPINVKANIHVDYQNIVYWGGYCQVNLYINEILPNEVIDACKNLKQIVFEYSKNIVDEDFNKFLKKLKSRKINIVIEVKDKNILAETRLKYFDFNIIEEHLPEIKDIPKNCKFISRKKFSTNKEIYHSQSSAKRLDKSNNFIYDEFSKSEIESLYLYVEE